MKNYCHADYIGITVDPVAFKPNIFDEPPTESELKPVPYYQPNLPKNVDYNVPLMSLPHLMAEPELPAQEAYLSADT